MQAQHPYFTSDIHDWKSQEITALQEALKQKVQGYVSEKWFYTHLKPRTNEKLPRIDMLNMLAQFVGHDSWQDFTFQHTVTDQASEKKQPAKTKKSNPFIWKGVIGSVVLAAIGILIWAMVSKPSDFEVRFCFQDADTQQPIVKDIEVFLLKEGETPQLQKVNREGCVKIISQQKRLVLAVKARYYQTDTIIRQVSQRKSDELVKLKKDDYALLIHLISKPGKTTKEKQQRRKQLEKMIDEEAQIFQVDESGLGVELYNKEDFIDQLSLPIRSLQNLEIIETKYQNNRIILLRFLQKEK
ncbi:hypothetical protein BKI52_22600 [marine bacterium AO1-C]|nr:hypothetical protein BKI52_22600 [marine bacterium AO1-C]